MKDIINQLLSHCDVASDYTEASDETRRQTAEDSFWKLLGELDASVGEDLVPGKHVRFSAGDGYAYYVVVKVGKRTTTVVHLPIGDAWRFAGEDGGKIPTAIVAKNLRFMQWAKKTFAVKEGVTIR
jgi:hypothetical protein